MAFFLFTWSLLVLVQESALTRTRSPSRSARFANEPPSGQLKLNSSDVDEFVHKLITAVAGLFPGPYYS